MLLGEERGSHQETVYLQDTGRFFAIHNDLAKANFDDVLVEFQKMSNLSVKVADDFFARIGKQVDAAAEKITKQLVA